MRERQEEKVNGEPRQERAFCEPWKLTSLFKNMCVCSVTVSREIFFLPLFTLLDVI